MSHSRKRLTAILSVMLFLFDMMPISAMPAAGSISRPGNSAPISDPCTLEYRFSGLRSDIQKLADAAKDAGNTAERLRRSSRHAPYKHVENDWAAIQTLSKPILDELSDIPTLLNGLPDDGRNGATLALVAADQNAVEQIVDYGHSAAAFERAENVMSVQYRRTWGRDQVELSFSTPEMAARMRINLYARQQLNVRFTEIDDALRSLSIAEHHYGKACGLKTFHTAAVADPCGLTHKLLSVHLSILQLAQQARRAGSTAEHLHKTSLLRPYRSVERAWYDVSAKANTKLQELSTIFLSLLDTPDTAAKETTLNTVVSYQNALEHIVHYTNYALYYERAENEASYNDVPETLTFGVTRQNNKAVVERSGSLLFDGVYTEVGDALRSLKLPESSYASTCGMPAPYPHVAAVANPCGLSERFIEIRSSLTDLKNEARDAGQTAITLHHTSRSIPYHRVEKEWSDIKTRSVRLLDALSDIPVSLRGVTNDQRKQAAMEVIGAYHHSVDQILEYTHFAVDYERAENSVSTRLPPFNFSMNFGVEKSFTRASSNTASRNVLEGRLTELGDSVRSLKIPEYNYDKLCEVSIAPHGRGQFASLTTTSTMVSNPCSLQETFQTLHLTILRLERETADAADTAVRIRNTPLGRRYRHIENSWSDVRSQVEQPLNTLTDFPILLDASPDGPAKNAALDLTGAYENAITQLIDYGRSALFLERTENAVSMNETTNLNNQYLNFGVTRQGSKMSTRNAARNQLEARTFEGKDALLSLRVPEHRYGALCHVAFTPPTRFLTQRAPQRRRFLLVRRPSDRDTM